MSQQYRREPLTSDETDALIKACKNSDEKLVIWTLLETGMRVSEIASLTKANVDFQTHRLTVYGKGRGGKKVTKGKEQSRSKRRILGISRRLQPLLEPYLVANDRFGMSVSKIQRIVKRIAGRAGVLRACSPHVCRHTFAVMALQKGVSLRTLQLWLGHDNLQTTSMYLNLAPEEVCKEFDEKW